MTDVGAVREIQDGIQDGCHNEIEGCVLDDLLYWLTTYYYTK